MDIYSSVVKGVAKQLEIPPEEVARDKRLVEDLHADSLDIVVMIMEYEQDFNIRIPERDIGDLVTIGDIVEYLESHIDG